MTAQGPQAGRAAVLGEIFLAFLSLGLTSFGGPVAHLGYFRQAFVTRRRWLSDAAYADLVAFCQLLPGPASSEVGIAIGLMRGGLAGAVLAWLGFTAPSAAAMMAFAYALGASSSSNLADAPWLHGLKVVAVAVVAQAVSGMARSLAPDRQRFGLAVAATVLVLAWPGTLGQVAAILAGATAGLVLSNGTIAAAPAPQAPVGVSRRTGALALSAFVILLVGLPLLARAVPSQGLAVFDSFFRAGSLVFGGGHVVLPLLQAAVVPRGWIDASSFVAGYGAAQAVPGPLFTFAAYLGAALDRPPNGWAGGLLALVAIFLPAFLLVIGALPFWETLRRRARVHRALRGVNAAVVGLLLAALYKPVWTSAIASPGDFALALVAFWLLVFWHAPPWLVVILTSAGAAAIAVLPGL